MDIIKTVERWRSRKEVLAFFNGGPGVELFSFSCGRGKPKDAPARLWFVHRGRVIGSFEVAGFEQRGLPEITDGSEFSSTLDDACGQARTWNPKPGSWMVVCRPPFMPLLKRIYHEGFRGWRYFDLEKHSKSVGAKIRI